ncbi:hypothetical protein EHP00_33 [Ecytonucleospora hepatopenaei]|uniref:Uncharacterized protein n=1 Tax=Ecytonucleospora hepatopenaei TaxID=646526 RepID=A0A1W0E5N9_9MICR|nr:hypothetical protein EHP00_33 [Ecytonucleospora hepatopenaei]
MFVKLSLAFLLLSVFIFVAINVKNQFLPSVTSVLMHILANKTTVQIFILSCMLIITSSPLFAVTAMFLYTGKYLYYNNLEFLCRYKIFSKTMALHYGTMCLLHSILTFMMVSYDEQNLTAPVFYLKQIAYSNGIYTLFITLISTSLKIPFVTYLIELALLYDSGLNIKPILSKTHFLFMLYLTVFMFSFFVEYKFEHVYMTYITQKYNGYIAQLDTLTDTTYSMIMFGCFYSAALNFYKIW